MKHRRQRNIPSHRHQHFASIDWDAQPLGELADRKLAGQLDVSVKKVRTERQARGIERA